MSNRAGIIQCSPIRTLYILIHREYLIPIASMFSPLSCVLTPAAFASFFLLVLLFYLFYILQAELVKCRKGKIIEQEVFEQQSCTLSSTEKVDRMGIKHFHNSSIYLFASTSVFSIYHTEARSPVIRHQTRIGHLTQRISNGSNN